MLYETGRAARVVLVIVRANEQVHEADIERPKVLSRVPWIAVVVDRMSAIDEDALYALRCWHRQQRTRAVVHIENLQDAVLHFQAHSFFSRSCEYANDVNTSEA